MMGLGDPRSTGEASTNMKLPRFTLRRQMIFVAIAGMSAGLFLDYEARRHRYRQLRSIHWDRWMRVLQEGGRVVDGRTAINHSDFSESIRSRADHHKRLVNRYEWAALNPWMPVALDPPEPE
jgi:hypothetical protein